MSAGDFDEHVSGKWFAPIARRLEHFENDLGLFEDVQALTEPDSPDWAINCLIKVMKPFGKITGLPFDGKFEAQQIGAMVGAKASTCTAMAMSHKFAQSWPRKSRAKFVDAFGLEATKQAEAIWRRFAETLQPKFERIQRFAANLAMKQSYFEHLEYQRGLVKGLTFMLELRKTIRKATTKAERDTEKRSAVYLFAISGCEVIQATRTDLSWPELSEAFEEAFEHRIGMDEDAFKKVLQRCGLRMGKPGRPIPISV